MAINKPKKITLPYNVMNENLADHAVAIGYVCIYWGLIEINLDKMVTYLTQFKDMKTAIIFAANMDIRDKIDLLKALGFANKPDQEWYDEFARTLNIVNGDLRPRRNRYVHDIWTVEDEQILKITMKTKIANIPPSGEKELVLETPKETTPEEIWKLCREMIGAALDIAYAITTHQEKLSPPETRPLS